MSAHGQSFNVSSACLISSERTGNRLSSLKALLELNLGTAHTSHISEALRGYL